MAEEQERETSVLMVLRSIVLVYGPRLMSRKFAVDNAFVILTASISAIDLRKSHGL